MSPYLTLFWFVAAVALAIVLGSYLARTLRMPDYGWKISLILGTVFVSAVVVAAKWPPKFGIDLAGGVTLIYQADPNTPPDKLTVENMAKVVDAVKRRVNPGGQKEITIRQYGSDQVEIIIPERSEAEANRVGAVVSQTGQLEFRILANKKDHKQQIDRALEEPNRWKWYDSSGKLDAWFVPIREGQEGSIRSPDICTRTRQEKDKTVTYALVVTDPYDVTGEYLTRAAPSYDQKTASPCVAFTFNSKGGMLFGKLTGDNLPDSVTEETGFRRMLGIILDGELYSAPNIQSRITDDGQITGGFNNDTVNNLVDVLNAGALPIKLDKQPVQRLVQGPTLGSDTIEKSLYALAISSILVPLFMLYYYRFSGILADIVLALNIGMLVALMLLINARFTLPGLAGVALTIGMAVDGNVLIYERLREELAKGAAMRMAIRNAFHRAGTTIIDSNLTTLLAAVVMYVIGTDQIKGFAITLFLGVAISLYTVVFVSRVIFDVAERHRWITQLKMKQIIGETHINFMKIFAPMTAVSVVVIAVGLALTVYRGAGLFDIDFTGGTSVQILFHEPHKTQAVREALANEEQMPDLAVSDSQISEDKQRYLRFVINTSNQNEKDVEAYIQKVFADALVTNQVKIGPVATIAAPPVKPAAEERKAETPVPAQPSAGPPAAAPSAGTPAPAKAESPKTEPPSPEGPTKPPADQPPKAENGKQSFLAPLPAALGLLRGVDPLLLTQVGTTDKTPPAAVEPPPAKSGAQATSAPQQPPGASADSSPKIASPGVAPPASQIAPTSTFIGGSSASLVFSIPVEHTQVEEYLNDALKAAHYTPENVARNIFNAQYREGDRTSYTHWDIELSLPKDKAEPLLQKMRGQLDSAPYFPASNKIGGAVAVSTRYQAVYALIASWVLMILYLWVRFQGVAFGVAAVVALIHDVLVMLAAIAASYWLAQIPVFSDLLYIEQFKINMPVVAAFLTIIGFSANDTIVIFDRIREIRGKDPNMTPRMINDSVNQTLSRSIITSITVFIVVLIMYIWCGQTLRGFAFALIVGVVSGCYSTIYIASPILLWLVGKPGPGRFVPVEDKTA